MQKVSSLIIIAIRDPRTAKSPCNMSMGRLITPLRFQSIHNILIQGGGEAAQKLKSMCLNQ